MAVVSPTHNLIQNLELIDQHQHGKIQDTNDKEEGREEIQETARTVHRFGGSHQLLQPFIFDEESGISWTAIRSGEGNVINCFSGDNLIVNIGPTSAKKVKPYKLKTCTILTVTSQLAGSLLAVSKQGSGGSITRGQVQALLCTSALTNAAGFLFSLGGLWLKPTRPAAAYILEAIGCAFAAVGFFGMVTMFFL